MVADSLCHWLGGGLLAVGAGSLAYSVSVQSREGGSPLSILASTDGLATAVAGSLLLNARPCSHIETAIFLIPFSHTFASNVAIAWENSRESRGIQTGFRRLGIVIVSLILASIIPWISTLSQERQRQDFECEQGGGALRLISEECIKMDMNLDSVEEQQESIVRNIYDIVNEFKKFHKARFLTETRDFIEPQYTLENEMPKNLSSNIDILNVIANSSDLKPEGTICDFCYLPVFFVAYLLMTLFVILYILPIIISLFIVVKSPNKDCVLTLILTSAFLWGPEIIRAMIQSWLCTERPSQAVESILFFLSQGQYIIRAFIHQRLIKVCSKKNSNKLFGPLIHRKLADGPSENDSVPNRESISVDLNDKMFTNMS